MYFFDFGQKKSPKKIEKFPWNDYTLDEAKKISQSEGKLIMIDFYADWWAACKQLDTDTFIDEKIISFCEENFINLKINTDTEDGLKLFKKFNGTFLPTILFLDSKENEIDRFIGYYKPSDYLEKINNVVNNVNTLDYFLTQYSLYSDSTSLALKIGNKYLERDKNDAAKVYFQDVLKGTNTKEFEEATYKLAFLEYQNDNFNPLLNFIDNNPTSDYTYDALRSIIRHYKGISDTTSEIKYHLKFIDLFPMNANALNSYGWRMSELEINLDDALEKTQLAIKLSSNDSNAHADIIDTEAEILWKLGRIEEAIIAIEKAIAINPKKEYFKDQKEKFKKSLN